MSSAAGQFDVVLIGSGLGATSCAFALAHGGKRVAFVPGVGRSRSLDADGGLIQQGVADAAFGPDAPLGPVVSRQQRITAPDVQSGAVYQGIVDIPARRTFHRLELETWAQDRAISAGADFFPDFVEGKVLPAHSHGMNVTEEYGDCSLHGDVVGLCEGSDPRIAMRVGLRPDYGPEDQLHFATTVIARPADDTVYRTVDTRTRWGMPVRVSIVPLGSRILVSVVARIENIMRSAHSSRDALEDLLASPLGDDLGLGGTRLHTGIELVALRQDDVGIAFSHGGIMLGFDASGLVDPREVRRADLAIQGGTQLAAYMLEGHSESRWDDWIRPLGASMRAYEPRWHDSRGSGFLEEGPGRTGITGMIGRIGRGVRRGRLGT